MTRVRFLLTPDGRLCGFLLKGHSGADVRGYDIVCAAISSATQMAANTVTEICGCRAFVREKDGYLFLSVLMADLGCCQTVLRGLQLHLTALREQYPAHILIETTEV